MEAVPDWDSVFRSLESYRKAYLSDSSVPPGEKQDPSVTAISGQYARDPWAVLVSTIISLRTKDEVTSRSSRALLKKAPGPKDLLKLDEEEIARLIYPAGFYRTKAASLKKIASILNEQYGGSVPPDMDKLLALPGVGRKTANLVLTEAFDIDAICVDVHVHRICNRAGWIESAGPEETEMLLRQQLPRKYWKRINALLVLYGQQVCRPVSPFCSKCVISAHCLRRGVERKR